MPRTPRIDIAGELYHIINRANGRNYIFAEKEDFESVLICLSETVQKIPIQIFAFVIMSNHWHFAVKTYNDGDVGKFFGRFTQVVTQRWHIRHSNIGSGHLFQNRFKSIIVNSDAYFIQLMRYIEANPVQAGIVNRAEDWKWGSLYLRKFHKDLADRMLTEWVIPEPENYLNLVNGKLLI